MGKAIGSILCDECKSKIPGYSPGRPLTTRFKRKEALS